MRKNFTCGFCDQETDATLHQLLFTDVGLSFVTCGNCHRQILVDVAAGAAYDRQLQAWYYDRLAVRLDRLARQISDRRLPVPVRNQAVTTLRFLLQRCAEDPTITDLTSNYAKTWRPTSKVGYASGAASTFITKFRKRYLLDNGQVRRVDMTSAQWLQAHCQTIGVTRDDLDAVTQLPTPPVDPIFTLVNTYMHQYNHTTLLERHRMETRHD